MTTRSDWHRAGVVSYAYGPAGEFLGQVTATTRMGLDEQEHKFDAAMNPTQAAPGRRDGENA